MEQGTVFKVTPTGDHDHDGATLWFVSKYVPEDHLVQYLVSTENRVWSITVESVAIENNLKTKTTVTYTFTGLNDRGSQLNQKSLDKLFKNNLQDWAGLINKYFEE